MLHPDPLSMTIACFGLLMFILLWIKNKKHLARPFFNTTELFVIIAKENPYDFEGNRVFDTKAEAERYLYNFTQADKFKVEPIETALDKLKQAYFNKGFDGVQVDR